MSGATLDPVNGAVRITRAELAALAAGHDVDAAPPARDLLQPVLATLATARSRGVLRRWHGGPEPVVEIVVGDAGVVVLAGGGRPDDVQEPRWHPRPTAVARIVAELVDLPTRHGPPPVDQGPHRWQDLVDRAGDPHTGLHLADLRWAEPAADEHASVLVVLWHHDGGMVELRPGAEDTLTARPVEPLDIWTGLTALATSASSTAPTA